MENPNFNSKITAQLILQQPDIKYWEDMRSVNIHDPQPVDIDPGIWDLQFKQDQFKQNPIPEGSDRELNENELMFQYATAQENLTEVYQRIIRM